MCICLPIKEPLVTCYKHQALPLSILEATMHYPMEIVLQNYLQLYTSQDILHNPYAEIHWLEFKDNLMVLEPNPFFDIQKFEKHGIEKDNFKKLIETSLEQGYYVYLPYDGFYLNNNAYYQKKSCPNNLLIYGYNKQTKECKVYDYDYVYTHRLKELEFDINVLYNATIDMEFEWAKEIVILKPKVPFEQDLHIINIKNNLSDYISSKPITYIDKTYEFELKKLDYVKYGLSIYEVIEGYLNGIITGTHSFSILPFSVLWDHKKCITYIVKKLFNSKEILEPIINVENSVLIMRNLGIKHSLTSNKEILKKMIVMLKKIQIQESQALHKIVNLL